MVSLYSVKVYIVSYLIITNTCRDNTKQLYELVCLVCFIHSLTQTLQLLWVKNFDKDMYVRTKNVMLQMQRYIYVRVKAF